MEGFRAIVSGRVQGVAFRAHTRRRAAELGLSGHVRNLANGTVEVVAAGDRAALAALRSWLESGPPWARVTALRVETAQVDDSSGFEVRY